MNRSLLGALIAVAVLFGSTAASASSAPALASVSFTQTGGFMVCNGPHSVTITASRLTRPALFARIQAHLPRTIPSSTRRIPLPDAGSSSLVLVFRDGQRRQYVNDTPPSLRPVVGLLRPLVHLCGR
jgi:hypothetical protein